MRKQSGVTLIELLIAVAVISVVLVPILGFYNLSLRQSFKSKEETTIKFLAEEEMEKFVSLDYYDSSIDVYASPGGRTNFFERGAYLVKTTVIFLDPETGEVPENYPLNQSQETFLKKIIISVARKDKVGGQVDLTYFKSP